MDANRLQDLLRRFPDCRVAVLGDFFLDRYLDVDPGLAERSLETGKTAHQVVSVRSSPGAAGTVVNNLAALGAGRLYALGFTGDDGEGYELRKGLETLGCDTRGLATLPGRFTPTYLKPRDCRTPGLAGERERYDTKNRQPLPLAAEEHVLVQLSHLLPVLDAVIVADQVEEEGCGVATERVRKELARVAVAHPSTLFWADSRRRIGLFRNVIVKVNAAEAVGWLGASGSGFRGGADDVRRAVVALRQRIGTPVFVTEGAAGIWVSDPEPELVPGVALEGPTDPTGAGDSATAGAVLALCAGATVREAALVANLVASITVQQLGTTGTASPAQLVARLETWRRNRSGCR